MRLKTIGVVLAVLVCTVLVEPRAQAAEGDVTAAGGGTVPQPAEGFAWQKVRETDEKTMPKVQVFLATKEGSTSKVVLIVEQTAADTDAKKIARIKGDYNGIVTALKEQGVSEMKGIKPPIEPPVPQRVSFLLTGKNKEGAAIAYIGAIFFGKSVYHFQIAAGSEEEAKSLAKVAEAVKE